MSDERKLGGLIAGSGRIVAFTGAGISAESGIPTYRGEGGVWHKYDPNVYANINYFLKDPTYYWEYYREVRYPLLRKARPNDAHLALARLEEEGKLSAVITQNVDGLHQEAGSQRVIELHGTTRRIYCMSCGVDYSMDSVFEMLKEKNPPACTSCGGMLRPAVVFFGEQLPQDALDEAIEEARSCDLMLAIGSSLVVHPAASLPVYAKESGARLAIINKGETPLDEIADLKTDDAAGAVLPAALKQAGL
jgi:NAD-dependent deacetylase